MLCSVALVLKIVLGFLFLFETRGQLSSAGVSDCPAHLNRGGNLVAFGDRCYDVVTFEKLSWADARERCIRDSGRLVEIGNAATFEFLRSYLSTLDGVDDGVWIGLTDRDNEENWHWDSGARLTYQHWGTDQPNGLWGFMDDCAVMSRDGFWSDLPCDVFFDHYHYICQYDIAK